MFARVFDTAKRILSRSPSVQAGSSHGRDTSPIVPLDNDNKAPMVSTRQGTETLGAVATTPRSSAKKKAGKRQLESQDTPSQAKRLRKSPPTAEKKLESKSPEPPVSVEDAPQEVEEPELDSAHVTTSQHEELINVEGLPIRRRTSRKVVVSAPASALEHTTEEDIKESPDAKTKAEDDQTPSSKKPSGSKKAHKRFGSEEPAEVQEVPTVAQSNEEQPNDEDYASDSSEAPEVIATATATSKAKSAQQETERAVKAQAAKEEAKRAKREARVAEEQAQRRLKEEKKAKKLAKKLAKQEAAISKLSLNDDEGDGEDTPTDSKTLPALLPDSLLNAIDEQRPPTPPPEKRGKTAEERRKEKLSHHIKFLERSQKPIKDVKKGKLKVAVLAQQNKVLPPKVNRDTRNMREHWLKGRTEKRIGKKEKYKVAKVERRSHGLKGFIRGED